MKTTTRWMIGGSACGGVAFLLLAVTSAVVLAGHPKPSPIFTLIGATIVSLFVVGSGLVLCGAVVNMVRDEVGLSELLGRNQRELDRGEQRIASVRRLP